MGGRIQSIIAGGQLHRLGPHIALPLGPASAEIGEISVRELLSTAMHLVAMLRRSYLRCVPLYGATLSINRRPT